MQWIPVYRRARRWRCATARQVPVTADQSPSTCLRLQSKRLSWYVESWLLRLQRRLLVTNSSYAVDLVRLTHVPGPFDTRRGRISFNSIWYVIQDKCWKWLLWQPISDGSATSSGGMEFTPLSWTNLLTCLLLSTCIFYATNSNIYQPSAVERRLNMYSLLSVCVSNQAL